MKVAAKGKDETKSSFDPKIAWGEKREKRRAAKLPSVCSQLLEKRCCQRLLNIIFETGAAETKLISRPQKGGR